MKYFCLIGILLLSACSADEETEQPYTGHAESLDFNDVVVVDSKGDETALRFDEDSIVSDDAFQDSSSLSADQIQTFLENTPYDKPSWLASEIVNGKRASDAISQAAIDNGVNPMMLLARFQVEGSHISKSKRPGSFSVNRALGCGCFDGQACQSANLGLGKQLNCAAGVLRQRFDNSVNGTGTWVKGVSRKTLDGIRVTPESHATAGLYAYTPWVLRGRGGNWLVWNITQRFLAHTGTLTPATPSPWVGAPCGEDSDCSFTADGSPGFCFDFDDNGTQRGICTIPCEGFCPDRTGESLTFCIASDAPGIGICTIQAGDGNDFCADHPGTREAPAPRFIGTSSATERTQSVCVPNNL